MLEVLIFLILSLNSFSRSSLACLSGYLIWMPSKMVSFNECRATSDTRAIMKGILVVTKSYQPRWTPQHACLLRFLVEGIPYRFHLQYQPSYFWFQWVMTLKRYFVSAY
jgi:hypothetical protein